MKKKESIFQLLSQKPWEPNQAKIDDMHDGTTIDLTKGKLGLRFIMVVSTIFFCLFIVTYSDRMVYGDWKKMPEPWLLWINTIVLFLSSFIFVSAQIASKNNQFEKAKSLRSVTEDNVKYMIFKNGSEKILMKYLQIGNYSFLSRICQYIEQCILEIVQYS